MTDSHPPKDLIVSNTNEFTLKNNQKVLDGIKEFVVNEKMSKLFLNSVDSLLTKVLSDYTKKISSRGFTAVDSKEIKNIVDCFRASVCINFKSYKNIYEGEVTEIRISKDETGEVTGIEMTLKTCKMSKPLKLTKYLYGIVKNISIGDVVYIEPSLGILKRIGRSENRLDEHDLEGDKYVQVSKGPVHTSKEHEVEISLYDVDFAYNGYNEDITFFTRKHVDEIVSEYLASGIVQFKASYLFIENCHLLAPSQLSDLFKASEYSPSVKLILAGSGEETTYSDFFSSFFVLNVRPEDPSVILKNMCPKLEDEPLREAVFSVLTRGNYQLILSILSITSTPSEFLEIFDLQNA